MAVVCFLTGAVLIAFSAKQALRADQTEASQASQQVSLHCRVAMILSTMLFAVSLSCKRCLRHMGPAVLEASSLVFWTLSMVSAVLSHPEMVARLMGYSVQEAFGHEQFSDSTRLLLIDLFITIAHYGIPMRWLSLLPMEVAGVALYAAVAFGIGSSEARQQQAFSFGLLSALAAAASLGKRAAEIGERRAFLDVITQKRLRCQAEFRLERAGCGEAAGRAPDLASDTPRAGSIPDSVPTTTPSGAVYDALFEDGSDVTGHLANIARMGDGEHWRIDKAEVRLLQNVVLGTGSMGLVVKGLFCGMFVAVKCPRRALGEGGLNLPQLGNELRVMRHLRHPNIAGYFGAFVDPQRREIGLVLELIDGVTLATFMASADPSLLARYQVMVGACRALLYMHTRRPHVVHGDLKSCNVMVEVFGGELRPKLLDFGLSRVLSKHARPLGGTPSWMAPEVASQSGRVACSADVYSFGHLVALLAMGSPSSSSCPGPHSHALQRDLANAPLPLPSWPQGCAFAPSCAPLVALCLRADPDARPGTAEVHERLLLLPQELDLGDAGGRFLQDVRAVASLLREMPEARGEDPSAQPAAEAPAARPEGAAEAAAALVPPAEQPPRAERLPPLPEGEPLSAWRPSPQLQPTEDEAMEATLIAQLRRWNYELPQAPCCEYHGALQAARRLCSHLRSRGCEQRPLQRQGARQCQACGILEKQLLDGVCSICGRDESSEESRPRMAL